MAAGVVKVLLFVGGFDVDVGLEVAFLEFDFDIKENNLIG